MSASLPRAVRAQWSSSPRLAFSKVWPNRRVISLSTSGPPAIHRCAWRRRVCGSASLKPSGNQYESTSSGVVLTAPPPALSRTVVAPTRPVEESHLAQLPGRQGLVRPRTPGGPLVIGVSRLDVVDSHRLGPFRTGSPALSARSLGVHLMLLLRSVSHATVVAYPHEVGQRITQMQYLLLVGVA